jgi:hypothetical protein
VDKSQVHQNTTGEPMSIIDYRKSIHLSSNGFYPLLMAAMRNADNDNLEKLKQVFPRVYEELTQRYNAPGGALSRNEMDWVVASLKAKEESESGEGENND